MVLFQELKPGATLPINESISSLSGCGRGWRLTPRPHPVFVRAASGCPRTGGRMIHGWNATVPIAVGRVWGASADDWE